jgi:hypothetical protein
MPFIIRILREDIDEWVLTANTNPARTRYIYTPASRVPRLVVSSLAPLSSFINEDVLCTINIEKSGSRLPGEDRTSIRLEQLNRKLTGAVRRLRLKIKSIERRDDGAPRVMLEELELTNE